MKITDLLCSVLCYLFIQMSEQINISNKNIIVVFVLLFYSIPTEKHKHSAFTEKIYDHRSFYKNILKLGQHLQHRKSLVCSRRCSEDAVTSLVHTNTYKR